MYGHADVVPVEDQPWTKPPFQGLIEEGWVYGRGAVDMKGALAMMAAAMIRFQVRGIPPAKGILFMVVPDEEGGGSGARYMVEHQPEVFRGVRHAIGEFGAFSMDVMGKRLFPVMIAEKQLCTVRGIFTGHGGHGSVPEMGGAVAQSSAFLHELTKKGLPIHVTPVVRRMLKSMGAALPFPSGLLLRLLTHPMLAPILLPLMGSSGDLFRALLSNTANPTIIRCGEKENVTPDRVTVVFDGRLLPGVTCEEFLTELRALPYGDRCRFEILEASGNSKEPDMTMFPMLSELLSENMDRAEHVIPALVTGATDGRSLSKLGIQTYGFTPMEFPEGTALQSLLHGPDERVPVESIRKGTEIIEKLLSKL